MELKEIMSFNYFVVVGDTTNQEKYAYKIKHKLMEKGYHVDCVPKEKEDINEAIFEVIDLCINPIRGLNILKSCRKDIKAVLIQPGAGSDDIYKFLEDNNIPYLDGCALVGISLYNKV